MRTLKKVVLERKKELTAICDMKVYKDYAVRNATTDSYTIVMKDASGTLNKLICCDIGGKNKRYQPTKTKYTALMLAEPIESDYKRFTKC